MLRNLPSLIWLFLFLASLAGCAGKVIQPQQSDRVSVDKTKYQDSYVVHGKRYYVLASSQGYQQQGIASWYGKKFHGRPTASGERYDMYAMTAAHKSLPLPTYVEVTNLANNRRIIVRVNDRGPFIDGRIIDLSYAAAQKLDMVRDGTVNVLVRAIGAEAAGKSGADSGVAAKIVAPDNSSASANTHAQQQIFIQLGAFAERANAEQLLNRLVRSRFAGVHIVTTEQADNVLHRVRIGPLATMTLADHTLIELQRLGIQNYKMVIE